MAEMKIGFIGLGIMGESMCENIINKGYPTWVYDINTQQVEKMVKLGAKACQNLEEIARSTTHIITMVPANEHITQVIEGLLPVLKKGTVIIDMSTVAPSVSRTLAEKVKKRGSVMLDAPVVKSKAAAIKGELGILVGGDGKVLEEIKPLLLCMGKEVIYLGPNGNGLVMKLLHNMLVGEIQNGVNEMLVMAKAAGLDFDAVIKSVKAGGGQNFYLDAKADNIKNQDFVPKFSFGNMHKDINFALDLANQLGLNLPGAKRVQEVYTQGVGDLKNEDFSASYKIIDKTSKKSK